MLQVADLPLAVQGLAGATLNNEIYMFGKTLTIKSTTDGISFNLLLNMYMCRWRGRGRRELRRSDTEICSLP